LPLVRHLKRPLALIPPDPRCRGQWLYLVFLWWLVVGNFERALVSFAPQRLVTEGVIHLNAVLCTLVLVLGTERARVAPAVPEAGAAPQRTRFRRTVAVGLTAAVVSVLADWGIVRALYGDRFAGHAGLHIRFGPNATISRPDSPR
jgi:hypothetical protein